MATHCHVLATPLTPNNHRRPGRPPNQSLSDKLYLSEKTVKDYASSLFKKLEVGDRVQAILVAVKNNIEEYIEVNQKGLDLCE